LTAYFFSRGLDPGAAEKTALRVLDGIVGRQAAMIAYNTIHFLLGALFLSAVVLVFFIQDKRIAGFKKKG
jgi:hypothetical protein